MNFIKGAADGQVDKVIDQAAAVAKEKVGSLVKGGDKKAPNDKKLGEGLDGSGGAKVSTEGGNKNAADEAMAIGKNLFK